MRSLSRCLSTRARQFRLPPNPPMDHHPVHPTPSARAPDRRLRDMRRPRMIGTSVPVLLCSLGRWSTTVQVGRLPLPCRNVRGCVHPPSWRRLPHRSPHAVPVHDRKGGPQPMALAVCTSEWSGLENDLRSWARAYGTRWFDSRHSWSHEVSMPGAGRACGGAQERRAGVVDVGRCRAEELRAPVARPWQPIWQPMFPELGSAWQCSSEIASL